MSSSDIPAGFANQLAFFSWWPLPHKLQDAWCNVGFWSRDLEAWYRARVLMMRTPECHILGSKQWKQWFHKSHQAVSRYLGMLEAEGAEGVKNFIQ